MIEPAHALLLAAAEHGPQENVPSPLMQLLNMLIVWAPALLLIVFLFFFLRSQVFKRQRELVDDSKAHMKRADEHLQRAFDHMDKSEDQMEIVIRELRAIREAMEQSNNNRDA